MLYSQQSPLGGGRGVINVPPVPFVVSLFSFFFFPGPWFLPGSDLGGSFGGGVLPRAIWWSRSGVRPGAPSDCLGVGNTPGGLLPEVWWRRSGIRPVAPSDFLVEGGVQRW